MAFSCNFCTNNKQQKLPAEANHASKLSQLFQTALSIISTSIRVTGWQTMKVW